QTPVRKSGSTPRGPCPRATTPTPPGSSVSSRPSITTCGSARAASRSSTHRAATSSARSATRASSCSGTRTAGCGRSAPPSPRPCGQRGPGPRAAPAGTRAGRLQCPYHAWTYGLDGTLRSAPHMDKVVGFREADFPLAAVAVASWDGHVFINLSPEPAPLAEQLAGLELKFRPWRMEELRRVERRVYRLRANWKLVIQNYSECLHCPIAHPLLNRQSHYMSGDNEPPQPTYLGGRMDLRPGVETLSRDGSRAGRGCLPGLGDDDQRRVYYYCVLPGLLLNLHPDYMLTFQIWPRAGDATEVVCEWHFHPDEIARPGFDPRGVIEFWDETNRQDWELSDLAQEGIASRGYVPGPYSNREELLYALDRFVLERVARAGR